MRTGNLDFHRQLEQHLQMKAVARLEGTRSPLLRYQLGVLRTVGIIHKAANPFAEYREILLFCSFNTPAPHPRTKFLEASLSLRIRALVVCLVIVSTASIATAQEQGWFRTGTGIGEEKPRIAVPDFAPRSDEAKAHASFFTSIVRDDLSSAASLNWLVPAITRHSRYPSRKNFAI